MCISFRHYLIKLKLLLISPLAMLCFLPYSEMFTTVRAGASFLGKIQSVPSGNSSFSNSPSIWGHIVSVFAFNLLTIYHLE